MAEMRMPHVLREHPNAGRNVIDAFWVFAIGVIGAYAFFAALGAFNPGDVLGVTVTVGVLVVLWVARAWAVAHHQKAERLQRDPRMVHARERRGF
jgi:steroid 5-alpha reductase family enzyme